MATLLTVSLVGIGILAMLEQSVLADCELQTPFVTCSSQVDLLCSKWIIFNRYDNSDYARFINQCGYGTRVLNIITEDINQNMSSDKRNYIEQENYWINISVDVSHNSLYSEPLMLPLTHRIERLNCSYNYITTWSFNKIFKNNPFSDYSPSLKELDISHNLITQITDTDYDPDTVLPLPPVKLQYLLHLRLGNNLLTTIPENIFKSLEKLDTLDLSHNNISTLDTTTFEGLIKLTYLDLSYNKIASLDLALMRLSSLTDLRLNNNNLLHLNDYDLKSLTRITKLSLAKNFISNVTKATFSSMKYLFKLDLSYNIISQLDKYVFQNNNNLNIIDLSYNHIIEIERGSFTNNKISVINIDGNHIQKLQRGLFEGLHDIQFLNLTYQDISEIENFAFIGLNDITSLNISNNALTLIPKSAFKTLGQLILLDLSNNALTYLTADSDDLTKVTWLSLERNKLSSVPETFLEGLVSLEYLDISHNNIAYLRKDGFKMLHNLKYLNVGKNPLNGDVEEEAFHNLDMLPFLDLSYSFINKLQNSSFCGMKEIKTLNISHNNLSIIEFNAFTETGNLNVLDVSFNMLSYFLVNNSQIENIAELILSHNNITHINSNTFSNLIYLRKLLLPYNSLSRIENDTFSSLQNLLMLDVSFNQEVCLNLDNLHKLSVLSLSGVRKEQTAEFLKIKHVKLVELALASNKITNVESLRLSSISTLVILDLGYNDIFSIGKIVFQNLKILQVLKLNYNKVLSIEPGSFKDLESLALLNISHNRINSLSYGTFSGLNNLDTLDLSYNQIHEINIHRLHGMPQLRNLIIDANQINEIHFPEFSQIETISLGENPLDCRLLFDIQTSTQLTAITLNNHNENVNGITCKGDAHPIFSVNKFSDSNASLSKLMYNSQNTNNILEDIKTILNSSSYSNFPSHGVLDENKLMKNKLQSNLNHFDEVLGKYLNMSLQTDTYRQKIDDKFDILLNKTNQDKEIQLNIYNEIKKENSYINTALKHLTIIPPQTSITNERAVVRDPGDSATYATANIKSDIDDIKDELKQYVASEGNYIVNELKRLIAESLRANETVLANSVIKSADIVKHEGSGFENHTSKFTEVCIGMILVIILCFLVFKLYKSKDFFNRIRSVSTQRISNNIEII